MIELNEREYAAIKIMAGFAALPEEGIRCRNNEERDKQIKSIAEEAVRWTDALFNELERTK